MKKQSKNKSGNPKTIINRFDSVAAFWANIKDKEAQPAFKDHEASQKVGAYRTEFTGTKSFEEATGLLLNGDRINADEVLRRVVAIKRQVGKQTKRQRVGTGVVGFAPNVPNYLAGVPRAMITATATNKKDKIINLVYNVAAPWTVETKALQKAVINLAGAIVALEAGGARVNVYVGWTCNSCSGGHKCGAFVRVKNASQPLDTLKMIYPLGSPSMIRRHFFRWLEVTELPSEFRTGYGRCLGNAECGHLANVAGVKCDRAIDYEVASENDYQKLARMIDTGVII